MSAKSFHNILLQPYYLIYFLFSPQRIVQYQVPPNHSFSRDFVVKFGDVIVVLVFYCYLGEFGSFFCKFVFSDHFTGVVLVCFD